MIGVIVVCEHDLSVIRQTVEHINLNTRVAHELILIDNARVQPLTDYLRSVAKSRKGAYLVLNNFRQYAAWNRGIKMALEHGCQHVAIVHDDALVQRDWLTALIPLLWQRNIGAVSPLIYEPSSEYIPVDCVLWRRRELDDDMRARICTEVAGQFNYSTSIAKRTDGYFNGVCFVLARRTIETVGMFDEAFQLDYGCLDLHERMVKKRLTPCVLHSVFAYHNREVEGLSVQAAASVLAKDRSRYDAKWGTQ